MRLDLLFLLMSKSGFSVALAARCCGGVLGLERMWSIDTALCVTSTVHKSITKYCNTLDISSLKCSAVSPTLPHLEVIQESEGHNRAARFRQTAKACFFLRLLETNLS